MLKLLNIQRDLKAPKSQYNPFGKYPFRSCEDILEAVKPLCVKELAALILSDKVVQVGERYYIEATATLYDAETGKEIAHATASAREEQDKKGMDASQVSGSSSSYARKYALNGLFDIDDTKDADAQGVQTRETGQNPTKNEPSTIQPRAQKEAKNGEEMTLEQAEQIEITVSDVTKKLKDVSTLWLERNVEKVSDPNIKKAMTMIIHDRYLREMNESGEDPFE